MKKHDDNTTITRSVTIFKRDQKDAEQRWKQRGWTIAHRSSVPDTEGIPTITIHIQRPRKQNKPA